MNPGIRAIRSYLPETVISNDEAIATHGFDEAFIREKLGIRQRHIAGPEEYVSDLASGAVRRLLDDTGIDPASVGLLIVVTQTPDYCLPHVSAMVQHRCNLPTTVAAFDISLGCSGYVYGLSMALAAMAANDIGTGILVTADVYSKLISPSDRNTAALFGDGATATLLDQDAIYRPGRFAFGTDGSQHETLIARGSAVRRDREEPLFMDGGEIFGFVMGKLPSHVTQSLKINNVEKDDIDAWVFHQASRHMLLTLAPRLGLSPADMLIDMEDVGNTTSSSIPIVLERRIMLAAPRPNRVFLCGFGVGLSWASTLLTAT